MTKRLTLKQLRFVNEYVSNDGQITATEAEKRAGYGESRATVTASELLNPQKHPEVVRYIDEMKKEMQHKTAVTYDRHVSRLDELSRKAEEKMLGVQPFKLKRIEVRRQDFTIMHKTFMWLILLIQ